MTDKNEPKSSVEGRERAIRLIQMGLTPINVESAVDNRGAMQYAVREYGVTEDDIEWLAQRWPLWRTNRRSR